MLLDTDLQHMETEQQLKDLIAKNENVMVCCGRMGPMCVPVYSAMEELEEEYPDVKFADMSFDIPDAAYIRNLPQCASFSGLPFTVYWKNGEVVAATSSIQSKDQIEAILKEKLS